MKVAIAVCGPLRSFSNCYPTWLTHLITPLEKKIGEGNVKIFIDYFHTPEDTYQNTHDKNIFTTKLEIDTAGWNDIINQSKYIQYKNRYNYDDSYIENIFNLINKTEDTNVTFNLYELKKYNKQKYIPKGHKYKKQRSIQKKQVYKSYYNFIQGICHIYNTKKIIDVIPSEYDYTIKIRADAYLLKPYPIDTILTMNSDSIYIQKEAKQQNNTGGSRFDTFYMAKTDVLKKIYTNIFKHFKTFCQKFIVCEKNWHTCKPENLFCHIIYKSKIKVKPYPYIYEHNNWKVNRNLINFKYRYKQY